LLLKQTKDATDRALDLSIGGPYVALGTYADMISRHDVNRPLAWSVCWDQPNDIALVDPTGRRTEAFAKGNQFEIASEIVSDRGAPRARSLKYRFGQHSFTLAQKGVPKVQPSILLPTGVSVLSGPRGGHGNFLAP